MGAKAIDTKDQSVRINKESKCLRASSQQVNAKLKMLESQKIDRSIQFQTVSFFFENVRAAYHPRQVEIIVVVGDDTWLYIRYCNCSYSLCIW